MSRLPDYAIPALDSGVYWNRDITFSIPVTGSQWNYTSSDEPTDPNYEVLSAEQAQVFREVIESWNELINLDIREVLEPNNIGDIRVAFTRGEGGAWARYPSEVNPSGGDVWLGGWNSWAFQGNSNVSWLLSHELGHALGLSHSFSSIQYDSGKEIFFTDEKYAHHLPENRDSSSYTVMSYTQMDKRNTINFDSALGFYSDRVFPIAPMLYDIAVIQSIYGANYTTRSGNTTYQYHTESIKAPFYTTIWDGGGIDTIDTSLQAASSIINLEAGEFSSIAYSNIDEIRSETIRIFSADAIWLNNTFFPKHKDKLYTGENNLAIAYGVIIENAIGGENNDILLGNEANNQLTGNQGNDFLNGKAGTDTAIYQGNYSQYSISLTNNTANQIIVNDLFGSDGIDTLENIEQLQFQDTVISVATLNDAFHIPTSKNEVTLYPIEGSINKVNYFLIEIPSPRSDAAYVHYETRNGSAIAGQDYIYTTGTAVIAAGKTHVAIGVEIINDTINEENETFSLVITQPSGGTFPEGVTELIATHTIIDNDGIFQYPAQIMGVNLLDLDNIA